MLGFCLCSHPLSSLGGYDQLPLSPWTWNSQWENRDYVLPWYYSACVQSPSFYLNSTKSGGQLSVWGSRHQQDPWVIFLRLNGEDHHYKTLEEEERIAA